MAEIWLDTSTTFYRPSVGNLWQERFHGKKFDSYLGRSSHPTQNHALRFYMRIFLNQINKRTSALDADKKDFPIKDWTPKGWTKFVEQFEKQANMWNHKFWLIPPRHFNIMDYDAGRRFLRPNIVCAVHVELVDSPAKAHRTINVFNIDEDKVKRHDDMDDDSPLLGKFRSDSHDLDSTDVRTGPRTVEDHDAEEYTIKHHYTIAHEIGHALGQDHIGQLKHTKRCELAMKFRKDKKKDPKTPDPGFQYRGGGNAKVCYGWYDESAMSLAENIMGLGYKFEAVNALPWKLRLATHTNTQADEWGVSLIPIGPQSITEADRHVSNKHKWIAM
jgi:hypothetical protein